MYSFAEMSLTWTTSRAANVTWRASLFETVSSSTLYAKVGHPRSAIYCVTIPPLNTLGLCWPPQHFHKTMCPAVFAPGFLSPCILHVFPSKPFALWMGHVSLQWRTAQHIVWLRSEQSCCTSHGREWKRFWQLLLLVGPGEPWGGAGQAFSGFYIFMLDNLPQVLVQWRGMSARIVFWPPLDCVDNIHFQRDPLWYSCDGPLIVIQWVLLW